MGKVKNILKSLFRKKKKVHILLDIDGVLNPNHEPYGDYEVITHPWGKWTVRTNVLKWLEKLSKMEYVQVHWISTWEDESNTINTYQKIKDFDYFVINGTVTEGKLKAIKEQLILAKGDTVIAIDDSLDKEDLLILGSVEKQHELVSEILSIADENQSSLHIIIPDRNIGITDEEIKIEVAEEKVRLEREKREQEQNNEEDKSVTADELTPNIKAEDETSKKVSNNKPIEITEFETGKIVSNNLLTNYFNIQENAEALIKIIETYKNNHNTEFTVIAEGEINIPSEILTLKNDGTMSIKTNMSLYQKIRELAFKNNVGIANFMNFVIWEFLKRHS